MSADNNKDSIINIRNEFKNNDFSVNSSIDSFSAPRCDQATEQITPDRDNYTYLIFLLIAVTKEYSNQITIQQDDRTHYKIILNQEIPKKVITFILELIEELSLTTIHVSKCVPSNDWVFLFNF